MSQLDDLIVKYTTHLTEKCGVTPDETLLRAIAKSQGPSIYNKDASTVAASDKAEIETVKNNFLIKKLGLEDSDELMTAIDSVIVQYGRSVPNKFRVVIYYMLTKHFNKEDVFA